MKIINIKIKNNNSNDNNYNYINTHYGQQEAQVKINVSGCNEIYSRIRLNFQTSRNQVKTKSRV